MAVATRAAWKKGKEVRFAPVTLATDGEVVAAVAGQQIVVLSYVLVNTTAQTVTWQSASTAISGAMALASLAVLAVSGGGVPVFATAPGEALNIDMANTTQVSGHVAYYLA